VWLCWRLLFYALAPSFLLTLLDNPANLDGMTHTHMTNPTTAQIINLLDLQANFQVASLAVANAKSSHQTRRNQWRANRWAADLERATTTLNAAYGAEAIATAIRNHLKATANI
jgi:hypothetical protein